MPAEGWASGHPITGDRIALSQLCLAYADFYMSNNAHGFDADVVKKEWVFC